MNELQGFTVYMFKGVLLEIATDLAKTKTTIIRLESQIRGMRELFDEKVEAGNTEFDSAVFRRIVDLAEELHKLYAVISED